MKSKVARSLVVAGFASMTIFATAAAFAAPPTGAQPSAQALEEAKQKYHRGLQFYDDGAYDAARVQFERAYDLAPSYKILYNIGLVYKQLNEFVGSLNALEQYLAEGGAEVPDDKRQEVTKLIENLKGIVAFANVQVNVSGAEIAVDDKPVGKSPLSKPLQLNPGRRKITAKMEGRIPDAKVVEVTSGDTVPVSLKLEEARTTVVKQGADVKPVVAWIITGAFAIGSGVTGFLTLNADNDLKDKKDQWGGQDADTTAAFTRERDDAESKRDTLALVTDILLIGTVISAGVATYFTWLAPKEKDATKGEAVTNRARVRPTLGGLVGTF